jgi:hypothetical protein
MSADEKKEDPKDKLPADGAKALEALRGYWSSTGREQTFFGADPNAPSGRSTMEEIIGKVGFGGLDDLAEEGESSHSTYEAGQRLSAAWKKQMAREGKLINEGQSLSDIIAAKRDTSVSGGNQGTPPEE